MFGVRERQNTHNSQSRLDLKLIFTERVDSSVRLVHKNFQLTRIKYRAVAVHKLVLQVK